MNADTQSSAKPDLHSLCIFDMTPVLELLDMTLLDLSISHQYRPLPDENMTKLKIERIQSRHWKALGSGRLFLIGNRSVRGRRYLIANPIADTICNIQFK